jgi:hypothetical protein
MPHQLAALAAPAKALGDAVMSDSGQTGAPLAAIGAAKEIAMRFRIQGLDPTLFRPLFDLGAEALAARGIVRDTVTEHPGAPCRISLDDVAVGDDVLLLHHHHQQAATPYNQAGPIFVSAAARAWDAADVIPPALARRMISLRCFDARGMMVAGELVEGGGLADLIATFFADPAVAYAHAHYAKRGCFAGLVSRS